MPVQYFLSSLSSQRVYKFEGPQVEERRILLHYLGMLTKAQDLEAAMSRPNKEFVAEHDELVLEVIYVFNELAVCIIPRDIKILSTQSVTSYSQFRSTRLLNQRGSPKSSMPTGGIHLPCAHVYKHGTLPFT